MSTQERQQLRGATNLIAADWKTEVVCDEQALTGLAGEWDDLYGRCSTATAFLSSGWLFSWWRSYGRSGRLQIVLVRSGGRLVAAAPLMRERRFGIPVLTPLGVGVSDFTDVLIDDSCAREAAGQLAGALASLRGWLLIDLPEVPVASAAAHLADAWANDTWTLSGSVCLELPAQPLLQLIATLPRRTAHTRRKKQRKIERQGITGKVVNRQAVSESVATLLRLHQQQWVGRGMNPEHGRPRFAEHLVEAVPVMVRCRQAYLVEYRLDDEVVAVDLLLAGHGVLCAYLYGLRPDLRGRIDVTQLLLDTNLAMAQRLGARKLSLLRGDEPYKQRWRPQEAPNHRVVLGARRQFPAQAYANALRGHEWLSHFVKTRLPGLRSVRRRLRAWRPSST